MISATDFWGWFEKNQSRFFFLNQIDDEDEREKLLAELLAALHKFCDRLFFEIGGFPDETQDLIITAEGNVEYFPKVEELVRHAPKLKDWNVIAFKPPVEEDFVTQYEGVEINPRTSWFKPLENKKDPSLFGIRLYVNKYDVSKKKQFLNAAYKVLDALLGEKNNALSIHHIELQNLPDNPEDLGFIGLKDISNYIDWRKSKPNS